VRRRRPVIIESRIPVREDLRIVRAYDERYDAMNFIIDVSLVLITGGLWFIWIFVREMRRR
jgi:hypothetical protein